MSDEIDKLVPESGSIGQMMDDLTPERGKSNSFGTDYDAIAAENKAKADAATLLEQRLANEKKQRNSLFQTVGGSSGSGVLSVGSRETYFGN